MAKKKNAGSTRNGRDSNPKMLGVKKLDGQVVLAAKSRGGQRATRVAGVDLAGARRDGEQAGRGGRTQPPAPGVEGDSETRSSPRKDAD